MHLQDVVMIGNKWDATTQAAVAKGLHFFACDWPDLTRLTVAAMPICRDDIVASVAKDDRALPLPSLTELHLLAKRNITALALLYNTWPTNLQAVTMHAFDARITQLVSRHLNMMYAQ